MAPRKKVQAAKLQLKLADGRMLPVLSSDWKYYYCGSTTFKKSNPMILGVFEVSDSSARDTEEDNDESTEG